MNNDQVLKEEASCPIILRWLPYIMQLLYLGVIVMTGKGTYTGSISVFGNIRIGVDELFGVGLFLYTVLVTFCVSEFLMPKILFKKRYLLYLFLVLALIALTTCLIANVQKLLIPYLVNKKEISEAYASCIQKLFDITVLFIVLFGPFSYWKILLKWTKDNNRIHELEKATIQSELQQLKNQINPHFLFNMLNNANVLIRKDPAKASETLVGLSELLRYQLYESSRPKVLLASDIKELRDFLNLEKLRRDHFEFSIEVIGEVNAIFLPPLLFIPFVENATKHNLDPERTSYIHIVFEIQNKDLLFSCINSKPAGGIEKPSRGGIGLNNSYRRLKLLYDDKYNLDIKDEKDTFTVNLKIPI